MPLTDQQKRDYLQSQITALEFERFGHETVTGDQQAIAEIDRVLEPLREKLAALDA